MATYLSRKLKPEQQLLLRDFYIYDRKTSSACNLATILLKQNGIEHHVTPEGFLNWMRSEYEFFLDMLVMDKRLKAEERKPKFSISDIMGALTE
jgi:hypothetical protein